MDPLPEISELMDPPENSMLPELEIPLAAMKLSALVITDADALLRILSWEMYPLELSRVPLL